MPKTPPFLPNRDQEHLLKAALLGREEALDNWARWRTRVLGDPSERPLHRREHAGRAEGGLQIPAEAAIPWADKPVPFVARGHRPRGAVPRGGEGRRIRRCGTGGCGGGGAGPSGRHDTLAKFRGLG